MTATTATETLCIAFDGQQSLGTGRLEDLILAVKSASDRGSASVLVFDDVTSQPIELDLRGSAEDVLSRLRGAEPAREEAATGRSGPPRRGPGRPRLGVVSREITLLPRHWQWLSEQPGGASGTLRKLVERARRAGAGADRKRRFEESAYRFMSAMAGNEPGYEEALRALFAGDRAHFDSNCRAWPVDVREHARKLAGRAFDADSETARRG